MLLKNKGEDLGESILTLGALNLQQELRRSTHRYEVSLLAQRRRDRGGCRSSTRLLQGDEPVHVGNVVGVEARLGYRYAATLEVTGISSAPRTVSTVAVRPVSSQQRSNQAANSSTSGLGLSGVPQEGLPGAM